LAVDLTNAQGAIVERETLKIDFVSLAADSGAIVTASATGSWFIGDTPSIANQSSTRRLSATLRNRDNGAIRAANGSALAISATVTDSSTTAVVEVLTAVDDRTNEFGYSATQASNSALANDGNFSLYKGSAFSAAKGNGTLTVRYGLASATATVTLNDAATASTDSETSVTATGSIVGADANDVYLPLTTKSAVVSNLVDIGGVIQTGYAVYYTISYSTSCVAGNMSPAANTVPVKVLTDNTGTASVTITNAFPLDTCLATVTWTGAANADSDGTNRITWQTSTPTTAISDPGGSYQALFKSSNKVTWTILDQFSKAVAGMPVQLTLSGANAPTAALATKTSDANGQVSHTWTDAKGSATATSDTILVSSVNGVSIAAGKQGSVSVNYKTALDVVSKLEAKYQAPAAVGGTPGAVSTDTLVPSTNIGGAAGILIEDADQLDLTGTFTGLAVASGKPWVKLVFTALDATNAAVTGIPTTVKITNGFLIDGLNKVGTERIVYANDTIWVLGLKTGVATVTATNGTLTATATINFTNLPTYPSSYYDSVVTSEARVLSATENGGEITAKVVDFYGNPVRYVTLEAVASGAARFSNGSSTIIGNSIMTDANGEVRIIVNGAGNVTLSLNSVVHPKSRFLKDAGDTTGTISTPGSPAGVSSVTIATLGQVDAAKVAADAATAAAKAAEAAAKAASEAAVAAAKAAGDAAVAAAEMAAADSVAAAKAAEAAAVAKA